MSTKKYHPPTARRSTRQMTTTERHAYAERRMAEIRTVAAEIGALDKTDQDAVALIREQRRF